VHKARRCEKRYKTRELDKQRYGFKQILPLVLSEFYVQQCCARLLVAMMTSLACGEKRSPKPFLGKAFSLCFLVHLSVLLKFHIPKNSLTSPLFQFICKSGHRILSEFSALIIQRLRKEDANFLLREAHAHRRRRRVYA
jgi:hypothetical protein